MLPRCESYGRATSITVAGRDLAHLLTEQALVKGLRAGRGRPRHHVSRRMRRAYARGVIPNVQATAPSAVRMVGGTRSS